MDLDLSSSELNKLSTSVETSLIWQPSTQRAPSSYQWTHCASPTLSLRGSRSRNPLWKHSGSVLANGLLSKTPWFSPSTLRVLQVSLRGWSRRNKTSSMTRCTAWASCARGMEATTKSAHIVYKCTANDLKYSMSTKWWFLTLPNLGRS